MRLRHLLNDRVTLVKPDGTRIEAIRAMVHPEIVFVDDPSIPVEEGDKIERALPSGLTEVYVVLNRGFLKGVGGFPDHYQVKVRKEGDRPPSPAGGTTIYHLTGANPRVNVHSTDQSTNSVTITTETVFAQLRETIAGQVTDGEQKAALLSQLAQLEEAKGTSSFLERYQSFIATAANHMTLLAPFIPALSKWLSWPPGTS